ncbi:uncharacterized protein [Halyomorpha halys]|uniref:uncharacterized protein isoform X2 n=1 Tax=Halyomorpha halys TaxID=286706 RepID=UPI0006D4F6AC|nr:uncharacterized protein LOC106685554 isoform X2 [Halyomorpha halys]
MFGKRVSLSFVTLFYFIFECTSLQTLNTESNGWYGWGCPPHATGQFPYLGDCKRFYNCYNGRGQLSICAPGTLFNPSTLECDFPSKVTCLKNEEKIPDRKPGIVKDQYSPHNHHHHTQAYTKDGSPDTGGQWHSHHHHQHNGWQHNYQPQTNTHQQPIEKSAKAYQHAGVQPPSYRMEPPPPPVYYQNPQYSFPAAPAQPVPYPRPYYPERFNQQPFTHQYSPGVSSSYPHNAPPPPATSFNTYQPVQPKQVYHTKTHTPSGPVVKTEPNYYPTYAQPPPNYSQGSPQGQSSFVFPDQASPEKNLNPNYNQGYYGPQYPGSVEPKPVMPAIFYPPVKPVVEPQSNYSYPSNIDLDPNKSVYYPELYSTTTEAYDTPKDVCPEGFSGLTAHSDCTKFLSCSHGRTFVMDCSPGTRFNPELLICDHINQVRCNTNNKKSVIHEGENLQPAETMPEVHIYRSATLPSESVEPVDAAIIDAVENITDMLINYNKSVESTSTVPTTTTTKLPTTTAKPVQTLSIVPKIRIESSPKENIITDKKNVKTQKQSFNPEIPSAPKARLISKRNSTLDKQIIRLRGSPSQFEGFVEMQLSTGSWGVVCDKRNDWKIEEAHVVCRSLGFPRGAELSWQGLPADVKNITSSILATDVVVCTGSEDSLLDCTLSVGDGCDPTKDGVWVRCYSHGLSRCYPGEMSLGDRCYSIVTPSEETPTENLVGFTQGEALSYCQKKGGHLVDITSQVENDFVSEWLIRQNVDGNIMTSGVGMSLMGGSIWIWEGSESTFTYHNWWPGWSGAKSIPPQTYTGRALCIILRRYFPCKDSKGSEDRLCDAQYYYWDVEDCDAMPTSLPYVCERAANKIGCVMGTGTGYKGGANVTKAGNICLSWDHKDVLQELKYRISEADRKVSLSGHNYCRNVAGKETHPWCYVRDTNSLVKKELCDIPICAEASLEKSARYFQCPPNYFACGLSGKCIPSSQVCDGQSDCSDSEDENNCQIISSQFSIFENSKLIVSDVEVFIKTPLNACAQRCLELVNCRSFSYLVDQEECVLSESNIGLSGNRTHAPGWDYYEVKSKSIQCKNSFVCGNGKCIAQETVCNGRDDCGDRSDEGDCTWLKQKIQIKLTGGTKPNEGTIEVKAHDKWGLVCDDEFEPKDGDVVCRHLGFPLGALEIKKHSFFNTNHNMSFIIDNLHCLGNETSIADCFHNGWGIHDCKAEEAAGVVCKIAKSECSFNYWQCEKTAECIPLAFLCDNVKDCKDHSDEDPKKCESPIEVRLVGTGGVSKSSKANEGRVEVRRFGVWGTICDDDFGVQEAKVVCSALGFSGNGQVYKEAAYGAGEGIIWLDQVHCLGNESSIHQCMSDGWGQTNCKHNEDVAVSCLPPPLSEGVSLRPIFQENDIESETGEILLEEIFIPDCGTVIDELGVINNHQALAKVASGFETVKGTYPWQASIRLKGIVGKSTHWCGAVVISRFHVITAAHCLRDYAKAAYFIRAGDYDNEVDEGTEQDIDIDEMWIHSGFDKGVKLNNDIALVKIKGKGFDFNTWVLPACLPQNNPVIPDNCTISGWGSNANPGTGFARTLHAAWLTPISYQQCRALDVYNNSLSVGMMCAGNLEGGPDSCQGDSGGPLLCPVNSQFTLFGITSWGHGCGRSNSPGVYTNILHYINWINDRIKISMKKQKYRRN